MKVNKRLDKLEKAIKQRYNRDVEIVQLESPVSHSTRLEITSPKKTKFIITEYREEGLTVYCTVQFKDKNHRYKRYVDAEIHIADIIGEEENGDSQ